MNTPVFDKDGKLLGDLICYGHENQRCNGDSFGRPLPTRLAEIKLGPSIEPEMIDVQFVYFTWAIQNSKRDYNAPIYRLRILIADNPDLLTRVRGYRPFPEIWGDEIKRAYG